MRNSSTLSLTSALYGGGWSMPRPDRFNPLKETLNPLYRTMGGAQGRSRRGRKIKPPPGFHPPDRPASSESLYRLGSPGQRMKNNAQSLFKLLKPAINANNMEIFSSCITGKTFRLYYKNQPVNSV